MSRNAYGGVWITLKCDERSVLSLESVIASCVVEDSAERVTMSFGSRCYAEMINGVDDGWETVFVEV